MKRREEIREEIEDALRQMYVEQAKACCGAGRWLIRYNFDKDEVVLVHDSACQRGGDGWATGEYEVLYAEPCSREDAWECFAEGLSEADQNELLEQYGSRQAACEDWAEEVVSTLSIGELYNKDERQATKWLELMVDQIEMIRDYYANKNDRSEEFFNLCEIAESCGII